MKKPARRYADTRASEDDNAEFSRTDPYGAMGTHDNQRYGGNTKTCFNRNPAGDSSQYIP
jgi:hypothetical protein